MDAIILDTETTDKDPPLEVIELAWQSANGFEGAVFRFWPEGQIKLGAMAVHHILLSDLAGKPSAVEALKRVPAAKYWIGHNIDFDWKALGQPAGMKRICTLAMSRALFPDLDSHTLTAMIYHIKGANPNTRLLVQGAHSALEDIGLCALLYDKCCRCAGIDKEDYEKMFVYSEAARVPTRWTFGKFKGEPISRADRGYANWYQKQPDPDPYLIEALRRARLL
jgi:exodeoxyribonuclease X